MPPLLYAAAWVTSWRDFSRNLLSISMLAFGLVGFTVLGVALAGPWLFPGFDWRIGFVLGAAVATTDAIAATSIAKRIGLPKRIVDLLEGEISSTMPPDCWLWNSRWRWWCMDKLPL